MMTGTGMSISQKRTSRKVRPLACWFWVTPRPNASSGRMFPKRRRSLSRGGLENVEKIKQDDNGDRDADQPEKNAAHETPLLGIVVRPLTNPQPLPKFPTV